jgi:hypothetical protein
MHQKISNLIFATFLISMMLEGIFLLGDTDASGFEMIMLVSWFALNCAALLGGVVVRYID